jgi:hypothetical protein
MGHPFAVRRELGGPTGRSELARLAVAADRKNPYALDPNSTDWTYVEGSRLTKENVQSLFPGFPASYQFPPFYRKKL